MTVDLPSNVRYRLWDVPNAKAVLLLVHGLGGHTGRWEPLAKFFANRGIASCALCLRGFGDSPGIKGDIDSFHTYLRDIDSLAAVIRAKYPTQKIFMLGESLGGLIVFLAAIELGEIFKGLICLSPAFSDTLHIRAGVFWKVILSSIFMPKKQFLVPLSLSCCSRDEQLVKQMEADPREHRFATARLLTQTLFAQQRAKAFINGLKMPVLFLLSGRDTVVSTDASVRIFKSLKCSDKTVKVYAEMYHALSIDLGRDSVFEDILNWVARRL